MGWHDAVPRYRKTKIFPICIRYWFFVGNFLSKIQFFYSYNYNIFTQNVRFRTFRNFFPFVVAALFGSAYGEYKQQVLKVNLFDEYCWLRSQELVKQNEYLFQHEGNNRNKKDFKRFIWWQEDLRETLGKVSRQANNHQASDFKDSELVLQDFIDRYVDPSAKSPMGRFTSEVALWPHSLTDCRKIYLWIQLF